MTSERRASPIRGLKVVIVLNRMNLGGAERQALLLGRWLKQASGARVEIWSLTSPTGELERRATAAGITCRKIPFRLPIGWRGFKEIAFGLLRLRRALVRSRVDVLMPYLDPPNIACGVLWRFAGARLCIWNQRAVVSYHPARWLSRLAHRWTSAYIANSRAAAQFLIQQQGADPARVHVVHNGVELAPPRRDRTAWRERLGISPTAFVVVMVAHFREDKDHPTMLEGWRRALPGLAGHDPALVLAGTGQRVLEATKDEVQELGLEETVHFAGLVEDTSGLLAAADLGALTSHGESFPNAVLEYMASGLPVVATDVPGIAEMMGPDNQPFLVPKSDPATLARRLVEMAASPDLRATAGAANRRRVERRFSPRALHDETVRVISETLRSKSVPIDPSSDATTVA